MKEDAQVVVIGGGIIGCSIAYHLAKAGCKDVILVEKGELTSGTTFHSVGLVTQFRTSPINMQLMNYSIKLFNEIKARAGDRLDWNKVGSLRVASSPAMLKNLQRNVSRAKALGLNVDMVTSAEAKNLFPGDMTTDGLEGAVYIPDDGYLEPNGVTNELANMARELGAEISTHNRVVEILMDDRKRITAVVTEKGTIKTEVVVNAAGQWAPRLSEMVGVNLPMIPMMHQYLITKPIPGHELPKETPVLRDPDNLVYIREEVGGYLIGGFELDPKVWKPEGVPWEFTQQLLTPEWDLFELLLEGAIRRCPILEQAEAIDLVNGPDAFTPDGNYALGPVPGLHGYFVAAGMSINGVAGAGGVGKIMAEWILDGQPEWDLHELNVRRFGKHLSNLDYISEKAIEVYKYYYHLHFPNSESGFCRKLRISPLFDRLLKKGAVFGQKNGWERTNYFETSGEGRLAGEDEDQTWEKPAYFDIVGEEHKAVRERVGILDMTSFGKTDIKGPGARAFLQKLCSNDIGNAAGSLVYTQMLNVNGGIEADITIGCIADDHFRMVSGTAFHANDMEWLRLNDAHDGSVEIVDVTEDYAVLCIWGPDSRKLLSKVTDNSLSNEDFPYMSTQEITLAKKNIRANRVSFVGELGWELVVPNTDAVVVFDAVLEAGSEFDAKLIGYKALDTLRIEKQFYYWSTDICPTDNPLEAGLGFAVKMKKGDFIGRDALQKIKDEGLKLKMSMLSFDDPELVIFGGESLIDEKGNAVSRVRTGGYAYTYGKTVALAYLPLELAKADTVLSIESFGREVKGMVEAKPLHDPSSERVKK